MLKILSLVSVLLVAQVPSEKTSKGARDTLEKVFERASKESDVDGAGLVLSSILSDESKVRSAFSTAVALDERSVYILFGGNWGSRARIKWKDEQARQRIMAESVSRNPVLIRSVIRADRYESYLRRRNPRGAATINSFPFFSYATDADDLAEFFIVLLRKETSHAAEAIMSPLGSPKGQGTLVTAQEMELNLLRTWQDLCGECGRLDLIGQATAKNWRNRFPELDKWFQENRPYMIWDNGRSCIRIDEKAKEQETPTRRVSRSIPELRPPWLPNDAPTP
jgi:hypothetical protein